MANIQQGINQMLGMGAALAGLSGIPAERRDLKKLKEMDEITSAEVKKIVDKEMPEAMGKLGEDFPSEDKKVLNRKNEAALRKNVEFNERLGELSSYQESTARSMFERNPTSENYERMKAYKAEADKRKEIIERDVGRLKDSRMRKDKRNAARQAQRAAIKAQKVTIGGDEVSLDELPKDLQNAIMNNNKKGGNK